MKIRGNCCYGPVGVCHKEHCVYRDEREANMDLLKDSNKRDRLIRYLNSHGYYAHAIPYGINIRILNPADFKADVEQLRKTLAKRFIYGEMLARPDTLTVLLKPDNFMDLRISWPAGY